MKDDVRTLDDDLRLQYLVEHLDQGIWDVDMRTRKFFVSKAWCDMRGIARSSQVDASGEQWLEKIHPDEQELLNQLVNGDLSQTGDDISIQYRYKHADGHWIWLLCRAKVMEKDSSGKAIRIIGTDTCIDDVKKSAEAHVELAEKLKLAIEASGVGIFVFTPEAQTVHWDDRLLEIFGLEGQPNEQVHTNWHDVIHPEDRAKTITDSEARLSNRTNFDHDYRIIRPDGQIRHLRTLARYVTSADSIEKVVGVNIDVTAEYERRRELEEAHNQLEHEARHDALTGLANRRLLDETVKTLDKTEGYAVLHLDLDYFKGINDTLGHAAGDVVLCTAAQILREKTGDLGLVCRSGGDEFVVLIKKRISKDAIAQICEEIVREMSKPIKIDGKVCSVGVSIGVAFSEPCCKDPAETFRRADKALYHAKDAGRGGFEFYVPGRRLSVSEIATSRQCILAALSRGEITCHYQPQYDAHSLAIVGAEALVRWDCPSRGLLAPEQFLAQAAETDVISHIDRHMLSIVLDQQKAWHDAGITYPPISLNIAKNRIMQPGLGDDILAQIAPYHALSFELLETAFIDTPDAQLTQNLAQLREMNIKIELDDFGSGHSSIVALQNIKPDRIKIDRGLVTPIVSHPDQLLTLSSLSCIARLAGAEIVIEGLETGLHLAAIRNVDCDVLQGFGLHRPAPADEFAVLLRKQQDDASLAKTGSTSAMHHTIEGTTRRH